jgi:hypothetical protein
LATIENEPVILKLLSERIGTVTNSDIISIHESILDNENTIYAYKIEIAKINKRLKLNKTSLKNAQTNNKTPEEIEILAKEEIEKIKQLPFITKAWSSEDQKFIYLKTKPSLIKYKNNIIKQKSYIIQFRADSNSGAKWHKNMKDFLFPTVTYSHPYISKNGEVCYGSSGTIGSIINKLVNESKISDLLTVTWNLLEELKDETAPYIEFDLWIDHLIEKEAIKIAGKRARNKIIKKSSNKDNIENVNQN